MKGVQEGAYKKAIETARKMFNRGISDMSLVSDVTGLSEEELKDILNSKHDV